MKAIYTIREDIAVDLTTKQKWQKILDLVAEIMEIPIALIMQVHEADIEVFARSRNLENVFKAGLPERPVENGGAGRPVQAAHG